MQTMQQIIVNDHIADLRHEADILRAERAVRAARTARPGSADRRHHAGPDPARVRLGHWLIALGSNIAGHRHLDHHADGRGDAAARAA
jgi:hypothetical protein